MFYNIYDNNIKYYFLSIFISLYFIIQRILRYKLLNESKKVNLNDNNEIEKECENVVRRILEYDQPLMARFALELGQFRKYFNFYTYNSIFINLFIYTYYY
jgi:hypothetical protein